VVDSEYSTMQQEISGKHAIHAPQIHHKPLTLYCLYALSYRRPRLLTGTELRRIYQTSWLVFSVYENNCQRITARPTRCVSVFLKASYNYRIEEN